MNLNPIAKLFALNRRVENRIFKAEETNDEEATVYLYDYIVSDDLEAEWFGGVSPRAFAEMLAGLKAKTVHLRVNSPGGSVFGARAMEQAIRDFIAKGQTLNVHVDGLAASAASFLILPASSIEMAPGAMLMIHNAWAWGAGNAQELTKLADLLTKIDGTLVDSYAAKSGKAKDEIADKMAAESWFTAQEAVDFGLADTIAPDAKKMDDDEKKARAVAPKWNLEAFAHAPGAERRIEIKIDGGALSSAQMRALLDALDEASGHPMKREKNTPSASAAPAHLMRAIELEEASVSA